MAKTALTSLDLYKWVIESSFLSGGRVRDVRSQKGAVFILIYKNADYWLKIVPGSHIFIQREKPDETEAFEFDKRILGYFRNKQVELRMHDFDRIIELVSGGTRLVFELFSNGNVLLVDDGKIVWAMFHRNYVSRKIEAGEPYTYPPSVSNVLAYDKELFLEAMRSSNKGSVVKALAVDLSLGGEYATEACFRAGLSGDQAISSLSAEQLSKIYDVLHVLLHEEVKPNIVDKKLLSTIELHHIDKSKEYFGTVNEAIRTFFTTENKRPGVEFKALEKVRAVLEERQKAVDYINEHYDEISNLMDALRDSSASLEARRKLLEENGWVLNGKVMSRKDNVVAVDFTLPLNRNIEKYYAEIKRLNSRLSSENRKRSVRLSRRSMDEWYAKFRWFRTSGGKLGVLGRDNNQNMVLIKKYTTEKDVILHADVFGSPFCVLKSCPFEDKEDIEEAAVLVAAYSSAWKNGMSSTDVYFVSKGQVTLSPPSGESLKHGAFYISGKRNYIKNVQLMVCIDLELDQGTYQLSVSAKPLAKNYFLVKPGGKHRDYVIDRIHNLIASKLGVELVKDDIDKLLPSGDCSLSLVHLTS